MIKIFRLSALVLATAVTFAGVGAVQASSADPQPNQPGKTRSAAAMGLLPDGDISAQALGFSSPAAAWTSNGGRLDVFQSIDNTVIQKFWTGAAGWSEWLDLGGPAAGVASAPSATWAVDNSRLDIFVMGDLDSRLYQRTFTAASGWSDWMDLGGLLVSSPTSTATTGGRIDVFVIGGDFRLYQKSWLGSSWSDWTAFAEPGAGIGSAPTATWAHGGRLDVFVAGFLDGALYQLSWIAGVGWSGWTNLGGVLVTAPGASWTSNGNRIDIFGVGTDLRLYQKTWINFVGWSGWGSFDPPVGGLGSLRPVVTWLPDGGRVDVVVVGENNGNVYQLTWTPGGWSGWTDLG